MRLTVLTPEAQIFQGDVAKVTAEATNGSFTLLPRHIDTTAPLVAGILLCEDADGQTLYFGIDDGILVKCAEEVSVAVRRALQGHDLAELRRRVQAEFVAIDEEEMAARSALARLESGVVRRILELERR